MIIKLKNEFKFKRIRVKICRAISKEQLPPPLHCWYLFHSYSDKQTGPYRKIQEAINAAEPHSLIKVSEGFYE